MKNAGILIIFLVFCLNFSKSQDTSFYLIGKVLDRKQQSPISGARVQIAGSYRAELTDRNGNFRILSKKYGEVLEIMATGYSPYFTSTPIGITPNLIFYLEPLSPSIQDNSAQQVVFRNGKWKINNFEVFDDKKILLATDLNSGRDAVLLLDSAERLVSCNYVFDKIYAFTKTSEGTCIILGTVNAYSFKYKNSLVNLEPMDILSFQRKYYSSPFRDSSGKYVRYQSGYDFYLMAPEQLMARRTYLTYHVRMKKSNRLSLFKNYSDEKFTKAPGTWKSSIELIGEKNYPHAFNGIKFHEVPWQIIQDKDKLIFFDLENFKAEVFDTVGKLQKTISFSRLKKETISQKMVYDKISRRFFLCSLYLNDNPSGAPSHAVNLTEINIETGSGTNLVDLSTDAFFTLNIHDHWLYHVKQEKGSCFLVKSKLR